MLSIRRVSLYSIVMSTLVFENVAHTLHLFVVMISFVYSVWASWAGRVIKYHINPNCFILGAIAMHINFATYLSRNLPRFPRVSVCVCGVVCVYFYCIYVGEWIIHFSRINCSNIYLSNYSGPNQLVHTLSTTLDTHSHTQDPRTTVLNIRYAPSLKR